MKDNELSFPDSFDGFSRTEYLSVFIALIYAFSVAEVLVGWSKMLRSRKKIVFSTDHFIFTVSLLLVLILNWYVLWTRVGILTKGFGYFLISFIPVIILYFWSLYVFPDFDEEKDLKKYTDENYNTILLFWATFLIVNIAVAIYLGEIQLTDISVIARSIAIISILVVIIFNLKKFRRVALLINFLVLLSAIVFYSVTH